jgi:hypothetical protein
MVDPIGQHWKQPSRSEVLIDDKCAVMPRKSFDELYDYSGSVPSGVYDGKMWKAQKSGVWYLRFYAPCEDRNRCSIMSLPILILEEVR